MHPIGRFAVLIEITPKLPTNRSEFWSISTLPSGISSAFSPMHRNTVCACDRISRRTSCLFSPKCSWAQAHSVSPARRCRKPQRWWPAAPSFAIGAEKLTRLKALALKVHLLVVADSRAVMDGLSAILKTRPSRLPCWWNTIPVPTAAVSEIRRRRTRSQPISMPRRASPSVA